MLTVRRTVVAGEHQSVTVRAGLALLHRLRCPLMPRCNGCAHRVVAGLPRARLFRCLRG